MGTRNQHLDQRMNWFDRQFLRAQDFADESDYHVDRLRRHLRLLHTPGVGEGLMVRGSVDATSVTVDAGTALDDQGREIVLLTSTGAIDLPADQTAADLYVGYGEAEAEQSQDPGIVGNTRIKETPQFSLRAGGDPVPGSGVLLARLALADGKLTTEPDNTVRTMAGAAIGDVSVFSLTLRPVGQPSTVWPRLTASGANQVSLAGDLNVHGSATVDGLLTAPAGVQLPQGCISIRELKVQKAAEGTLDIEAGKDGFVPGLDAFLFPGFYLTNIHIASGADGARITVQEELQVGTFTNPDGTFQIGFRHWRITNPSASTVRVGYLIFQLKET
jgi:hypothetical protein